MNRRVAVRGIILHNGKLLCVTLKKHAHKPLNGKDNYWCVPGGGVDVGEPLIPALEREIVEELGIQPVVGNLLYVQQFVYDGIEQLEFFFHITNAEDYLQVDLDKTSHGNIELDRVEFIDPGSSPVLPAFLRVESPVEQAGGSAPKFFNNIDEAL